MPDDLEISADDSGRRFVYNEEDNTWVNFGVVPVYDLVNKSTAGLVYPELYNKLKEIEKVRSNLSNLRLTERKPYFYLFHSSDKFLRFKIEGNNLRVEIDKSVIFRKLASSPCAGAKGPPGVDGLKGRTGLRAPLEKIRVTNNQGEFSIDVATPLDDQPVSLRGFDQFGEEQLWEILINLDGSYDDPDKNVVFLKLNGQTVTGQLTDPSNKFKIRQRGPKGPTGANGKDYVEIETNEAIAAGEFIDAVGSLWFNSANNTLVFNRSDLSAVVNNTLSVGARTDLPEGKYWAGLQISSSSLKSIEFHRPRLEFEHQKVILPQWTPLSGCYDQKRYTLGYLNYNTQPFDIIKDLFPEYSGCKEPFWFCGNSGNQPCDGEINVNPEENNILFIESTSSQSSVSSASSISSTSSSKSSASESSSRSTSESSSSFSESSESSFSESSESSFSESSESSKSSFSSGSSTLSSNSSITSLTSESNPSSLSSALSESSTSSSGAGIASFFIADPSAANAFTDTSGDGNDWTTDYNFQLTSGYWSPGAGLANKYLLVPNPYDPLDMYVYSEPIIRSEWLIEATGNLDWIMTSDDPYSSYRIYPQSSGSDMQMEIYIDYGGGFASVWSGNNFPYSTPTAVIIGIKVISISATTYKREFYINDVLVYTDPSPELLFPPYDRLTTRVQTHAAPPLNVNGYAYMRNITNTIAFP